MVRNFLLLIVGLYVSMIGSAQTKSPSDFLGYSLGSRFTPHWKLVNYFSYVATNNPTMVRYQEYGQTNEGRPLTLAFISSAENIQRLEEIRINNLRLANLTKDKAAPLLNGAPAIVWLSYNVHGNEASSLESSMLMLYELINPATKETKEWLKNTVVIIDPCLNPDGRDRYANWFNSVVGKNNNPKLAAREHDEPWPGGRVNHYYFDLNRDWAWQTQVESEQRIKTYRQWMPQVHVDYHEQGIDNPYYFAPATEPFHEVITPWQRDFQIEIGRNNAKYFDEKGWLYFTKQYFDLFYPSYGDTYPTFNGAIGMTYEQAGHGKAGAAVINAEGDTLTLYDRLIHHYTSGISTLETASKNAGKLISEFRKYFNEAVATGIGDYKTYIVKNIVTQSNNLAALKALLDKNDIQYASGSGTVTGYNYRTGKDENVSVNSEDIIISALQPRSALVKVLFEPRSKLSDSATYDITAWSLPYVYGLQAYATKTKIAPGNASVTKAVVNNGTNYGYVFEWNNVQAAKLAGSLLQKGIKLRFAQEPFEIKGRYFNRGSVIVLKTGNQKTGASLWNEVKMNADKLGIQLFSIESGMPDKGFDFGSDKITVLAAPKIALVSGEGVHSNGLGEVWHFMDQQLDYPITLINIENMSSVDLNQFNVLILPNGGYSFLSDKEKTQRLKDWLTNGGRLIAIENAVAALASAEFGIKKKKDPEADNKETKSEYGALKKFTDRERDYLSSTTAGSIYKVELDNTHPLAFGYPNYYYTLKSDDNVYEFFDKNGWNVGVIKKDNQVAGFVGAALKNKLKDGLLFGSQPYGRGNIVYFTDNIIFRSFWENGKLMLCNAIFLAGL